MCFRTYSKTPEEISHDMPDEVSISDRSILLGFRVEAFLFQACITGLNLSA